MHKLKSRFLNWLTLLSNNLVLISYWVVFTMNHGFLYWTMKRKKNEEYKECQITATSIFSFIFYIKCFAWKHGLKQLLIPSHFTYSFYALQDIWNIVMVRQSSYGFALAFMLHDLQSKSIQCRFSWRWINL